MQVGSRPRPGRFRGQCSMANPPRRNAASTCGFAAGGRVGRVLRPKKASENQGARPCLGARDVRTTSLEGPSEDAS